MSTLSFPPAFLLLGILLVKCCTSSSFRSNICPVRLPDPPSGTDVTPPQVPLTAQNRIINGDLVSENLLPFLAFLSIKTNNFPNETGSCTGTLLSPTWVLTAAHCVLPGSSVTVYTGIRQATDTSPPETHSVAEVVTHPNALISDDLVDFRFDIAVLRLTNATRGKYMPVNVERSLPSSEEYVRAVGYGLSRHICNFFDPEELESSEESKVLRQVDLPIFSSFQCSKEFEPEMLLQNPNFSNIVCAGYGNRACSPSFGDSGGPLIRYEGNEPIVAGITSFGGLCALDSIPTAFTRTSSFESWLDAEGVQYTKAPATAGPPLYWIGVAVGVVALVGAMILLFFFLRRRRRQRTSPVEEPIAV